jgi:hypothetical protein
LEPIRIPLRRKILSCVTEVERLDLTGFGPCEFSPRDFNVPMVKPAKIVAILDLITAK